MLKDHGKTAFVYRGREITYSELIDSVGSFASLIDVLPGDRVAILSENRPEWAFALFGIWRRGATAVPIDFLSSPEEIAYVLRDSGCKMLFYSNTTKGRLEEALKLLKDEVQTINFDGLTLPKPHPRSLHREPEDIALILYTSGTTGSPKGVSLTFKNLSSNIEGVAETGIAGREDSTLAILPFHHAYPLMVTLLLPLHLGATVVFLDKLSPEDILEKLRKYKISILVGVPRLHALIHRRIMERIEGNLIARALFRLMKKVGSRSLRRRVFWKVHQAFGGSLRYIVSGGAKLEVEIAEDLTALGFIVLEGYGLTETSPIVSFNSPRSLKLGSVGQPIKDVMLRIAHDGEVLVKGPNVMKGYWNRPEETARVIKNGWFHTGDLGYMDEEGFLYISGRKKELIVLGTGKNINPEEIERLIVKESDLVKEAGVMEINGRLHALIYPNLEVVKERGILNLTETIKWEVVDKVNRKLPEWKRIVGFRITGTELPKTRLGKIRRFLLPELYKKAEGSGKGGEDTAIFETEEGRLIASWLSKYTKSTVLPSSHLEIDLGLDSLGKVELMSFLEKTFGISLKEEDLSRYSTVGELVELVKGCERIAQTEKTDWKNILQEGPPYELPHNPTIFSIGRILLRAFFRVYNRVEVRGTDNLPPKPFILAPNHASYLDAFILASVLPGKVAKDTYFLGEESYFRHPHTALFGKLAHVITVNINRKLKESLQKVAYALRLGKVVVIFPEGARTRTGELLEFKKGVAILSRELSVPVVPVALVGTYESLSIYDRFPKPRKITVKIGKPIYPDSKSYEEIITEVRERVEEMCFVQ